MYESWYKPFQGEAKKAHELCWRTLAISRKDLIQALLIRNEKERKIKKKMGSQNIAKSSFLTYEHRNITLWVIVHRVKLKLLITSLPRDIFNR